MNVSVFPAGFKSPGNKLENITLRGFGGGWNAIETDLQMESTYLVQFGTSDVLQEALRRSGLDRSGSLIWQIQRRGARIVNMIYFSASTYLRVLEWGYRCS